MKFATIFVVAAAASMAAASNLLNSGESRALERKARHSETALEKRYRVFSGGQGTYYYGSQVRTPALVSTASPVLTVSPVPARRSRLRRPHSRRQ